MSTLPVRRTEAFVRHHLCRNLQGSEQAQISGPYKRDYAFGRLLDGHPYSSKVDQDIAVEVISPLNDQYALFNSMKCVLYSGEHPGRIVYKLSDDKALGNEIRGLPSDRQIYCA